MAAVLAPWPFLDGGAAAVQVATIFDGATVEEELLWRGAGGRAAARLGDGGVEVRLGEGGFEVVLARTCDGEVRVGARSVELRELSLCGVTALPIGPRTRVTVRAGMLTFAIVGTTLPKRLPRAAPVSWRRRAGLAAAALAVAGFGVALQATAPRVPTWNISDSVRIKVSLLMPSLHGGRAPSDAAQLRAHTMARAAARPAAASRAVKAAAATAATAAKTVPNRDRAATATAAPSPAMAGAASAPMAALDPATAQAAARAARATLEDDARKAAAVQAREAGIVGALAQSRASFLGDVHVAASEVSDSGAVALGAGDAASASGASTGNAAGASNGASNGSSDGNGADVGALSGDEVGEAYGVGGMGISGIGEGGGGAGDGTIGLGSIGTIGHGSGTGTGYGYGGGIGGLLGRRASVPVCTFGRADVRGSCDADLIRRVVRAHANEVRFCYEKILQSRPTLTGRSVTRFLVGFDGRVAASSAAGLPEVDACLAGAIRRWQFAPRCAAVVSYPFTFVPVDDAY